VIQVTYKMRIFPVLFNSVAFLYKTRRALGGAHVPPTKVLRRLTGSMNKTIVKPRFAAAANTYTFDFPDVKFRVPALIR